MNSEYKRLSTGYHYVRAVSFFHLFAQWPVGETLTTEHVSHNGVSDRTLELFIASAQQLPSPGG
jgi:hypothetical protein